MTEPFKAMTAEELDKLEAQVWFWPKQAKELVAQARAYLTLRERMQAEAARQQEKCDEWKAMNAKQAQYGADPIVSDPTIHAAWHTAMVLRALLAEPSNG